MKQLKSSFHIWSFNVNYITNPKEAAVICAKLLENPASLYGIDIETEKRDPFKDHPKAGLCPILSRIRLIQIYDGVEDVYIFDAHHVSLYTLRDLLYSKKFVAHNALFEIKHFTYNDFPDLNIGCSMLLDQLVYNAENSPFEPEEDMEWDDIPKGKRSYHSLATCVKRYFGIWISKENQVSDWGAETLTNDQLLYAALDALLTYKCAEVLIKKVNDYKMGKAYKLLRDMQHVVAEMELNGFPVDWQAHEKLVVIWKQKLKEADEKCRPFFGLRNLNSNKQMHEWVLTYFAHKPNILRDWPKTDTGQYTFTRTKIFEYKKIPAIEALLEYKKYAKLLSTYGESLREQAHPITKRLHSSFFLGQTRTGRMSSTTPNLQNLPKDTKGLDWSVRTIFKLPEDRKFVVADFSQIELRVAGALSRDPVMTKAFKDGIDLHKLIVHVISGKAYDKVDDQERFLGKAINFGLAFSMSGRKLVSYAAMSYDVHMTEEQGWDAYNAYHKTYSVYSEWCQRQRDIANQLGFSRTPMGKMRRLLQEETYTKAVNTPVQGGAAECMMLALIKLKDKIKDKKIKIINTIHDEIHLEVFNKDIKAALSYLEESMKESFIEMFPNFPTEKLVEAHSGQTWKEAK